MQSSLMPRVLFVHDEQPTSVWARRFRARSDPAQAGARRERLAPFETEWRAIEDNVFASYERLSGRRFRHSSYVCFLVDALDISGYTAGGRRGASITLRAAEDVAMRSTLIHELAHVLAADNPLWHLRMTVRLLYFYPTLHVASITDHLLANTLQEAVTRRVLPDPDESLAIARRWRGLRRAWEIVDRERPRLRSIILRT